MERALLRRSLTSPSHIPPFASLTHSVLSPYCNTHSVWVFIRDPRGANELSWHRVLVQSVASVSTEEAVYRPEWITSGSAPYAPHPTPHTITGQMTALDRFSWNGMKYDVSTPADKSVTSASRWM